MKNQTNTNVSVYLSSDLLSVLDEITKKAGASRSAIISHFLQKGLRAVQERGCDNAK